MLDRRLINFAGAAACLGMFAFAMYTEEFLHLEPCPLCIFQRISVIALGVVFLIAGIHNSRRRSVAWVYVALIALAALTTIGIAGRHVYIQSQPPGSIPACGAPFNVLLQMFNPWQVVVKVLHAGGECAVINWTFLGLSMPAWVLICVLILGAVGVLGNLPRRTPTLRFT